MSIKTTKVFYPHIVKEYDSVEQFVSENDYTAYYTAMRQGLVDFGIDINDPSKYLESLTEDSFEAVLTLVFTDQAEMDSYLEIAASRNEAESHRSPIFDEEIDTHLI